MASYSSPRHVSCWRCLQSCKRDNETQNPRLSVTLSTTGPVSTGDIPWEAHQHVFDSISWETSTPSVRANFDASKGKFIRITFHKQFPRESSRQLWKHTLCQLQGWNSTRLKEHEHVYIRQKRSVGSAGNKLIRREIHGAISEGKALMRFIYETLWMFRLWCHLCKWIFFCVTNITASGFIVSCLKPPAESKIPFIILMYLITFFCLFVCFKGFPLHLALRL